MNPVWNRDDAERIARGHLAPSGIAISNAVFTVRTLAEVGRPPAIYAPESLHRSLAGSWLVYVSDGNSQILKSSWLVVISKADGAVLYSGSANDEG